MSSFDKQTTPPSIDKENETDASCIDALLFSNLLVFPMVLNAAIELKIFEIMVKAGPNAQISASEIASQLPSKCPETASRLDRMLNLFSSHSLLSCSFRNYEDGSVEKVYGLTPACKFFLKENSEGSLSHIVSLGCHPATMEVWGNMKDVILEGGNLFEKVHGVPIFQYMNKDPNFNNTFNSAMAGLTTLIMNQVLAIYKGYEGLKTLVDVGGGTGKSLQMIISRYPSIKGINYDLPHVVQSAPSYPGIEHVGGNMFSSVPTGDAIMLKDLTRDPLL